MGGRFLLVKMATSFMQWAIDLDGVWNLICMGWSAVNVFAAKFHLKEASQLFALD